MLPNLPQTLYCCWILIQTIILCMCKIQISHYVMLCILINVANMKQETLIDPCIKGTMNVLNSCLKGNSVKRVVLTSSCSAIRYRYDVQQLCPLNESHWTDPDYCKSYNVRTNCTSSVPFPRLDSNSIAQESWCSFTFLPFGYFCSFGMRLQRHWQRKRHGVWQKNMWWI